MATKTHNIDFDEIKNQYTGDVNLLYHLLPGGVMRGAEFRAGSINGEPGDSFGYNTNTGIYADFATGDKGGSIIDLVMAVKKLATPLEAAEYIVNYSGRPTTSTAAPARQKKKTLDVLTPAPRGIPAPTKVFAEGKSHEISNAWAYRDKFGDVLMYDVRVNLPEGGKIVLPMHWAGGQWVAGTISQNRPLYRLESIAEANKIIIVEGCKTADALQQYMAKSLVITWQGGSNAVAKTDWSPLRGRTNVIIIPDADEPGRKAAMQIANLLVDMDCTVRICDTSSMESVKSGWDFADALADNWNSDKVFDFILEHLSVFGEEEKPAEKDPDVFETEIPEIVIKNDQKATIEYKDDYFKCLGYNEGLYFYYVKATGLLHTLAPKDHTKANLIALAPLSFWEANFMSGKQVDWVGAADYFLRVQEKIGMYDYTKVRGRGAWLDEGRIVLHIGDKLIVDDVPTEIHAFSTKYHYERRPPMYLPLQTVLPDKYSAKFIELCQMARWRNAAYGEILAGWVFSAMIGGIFPMRSHVYIDGEKKSGKSWLINNVIAPALGENKLAVEGATTEAGIRAALRADTLPVIFDESEAEQKTDAVRLQGVFNLARAAATSDGGSVLKGAANGQSGGVRYTCRSAFLFASINVSMAQAADLSRTIMLSLRGKPSATASDEIKKADYENFLTMSEFASKLLTPDYCRCLFTRAIKLAPMMLKSAKMISDCASRQLGDRRIGDQLGMVGAGVWHLRHQEQIDETNAKELIKELQIGEEKKWEEDDNAMALQWLLSQEIAMNISGTKSVVRLLSLINECVQNTSAWGSHELLMKQLNEQGIDIKDGQIYFAVASSLYPSRMFSLSQWGSNGWKSAFLRLPFSAKTLRNHYFCQFVRSAAIMIPIKTIGDMEEYNEI